MTPDELRTVKRGDLLRVTESAVFRWTVRDALRVAQKIVQVVATGSGGEVLVHVPHLGQMRLSIEHLELHDPPRYADAGWSPYV